MSKVLVIGGGAAGCFAAITSAEQGNSVTLIEKNEKIGKKLYITGKGRCNITNLCSPREFIGEVVSNPKFLMGVINTWEPSSTVDFFEENGCPIKIERGNRAFPTSDKSSDIIAVLKNKLLELSVGVNLSETVKSITKQDDLFCVVTNSREYTADSVIIATGGVSYPLTGSTGDGYAFAKSFGHKIIDAVPALCPINLQGALDVGGKLISSGKLPFPEGLSLKNVSLRALSNGKLVREEFGEMLFTDSGISGPIALTMSSVINRLDKSGLQLDLDLKPALDEETLDGRVLRDFSVATNKQFRNALDDLLPKSLIPYVIALSGIDPEKRVNIITKSERTALVKLLKHMVFPFASLAPIKEAIVTAGGVAVNEINPKTMESKIIPGLYFAGEVLDVDAFTGGFNLQIALSTAYAAGKNA